MRTFKYLNPNPYCFKIFLPKEIIGLAVLFWALAAIENQTGKTCSILEHYEVIWRTRMASVRYFICYGAGSGGVFVQPLLQALKV